MKKNLIALLAVTVMTMGAVSAAESTNAVSKWLNDTATSINKTESNVKNSVATKKQEINNKKNAPKNAIEKKKAEIAAQKKAQEQKVAAKKAENEKKKQEAKAKVEKKKTQLKQLFSND